MRTHTRLTLTLLLLVAPASLDAWHGGLGGVYRGGPLRGYGNLPLAPVDLPVSPGAYCFTGRLADIFAPEFRAMHEQVSPTRVCYMGADWPARKAAGATPPRISGAEGTP